MIFLLNLSEITRAFSWEGVFRDGQSGAGLNTHGKLSSVRGVLNQLLCNFLLCHGIVLIKGGVGQ